MACGCLVLGSWLRCLLGVCACVGSGVGCRCKEAFPFTYDFRSTLLQPTANYVLLNQDQSDVRRTQKITTIHSLGQVVYARDYQLFWHI
jgi:hypothetical protein